MGLSNAQGPTIKHIRSLSMQKNMHMSFILQFLANHGLFLKGPYL